MTFIPPPETVALVRHGYADGVPVKAIVASAGITNLDIIYRCVDGKFPDGSGVAPAPIPRRKPGMRQRGRNGSRASLVKAIWRTAERQVEEIETRLKAAGLELAEREGNARALATMVKTLRELAALDDAQAQRRKAKPETDEDDDDPIPRDIDEFRNELARRINALVDSRTGGGDTDNPA
jgi:hypothetical protein